MPQLRVDRTPNQDLALTNCVFLHASDHAMLAPDGGGDGGVYVEVIGHVFTARAVAGVAQGSVALNSLQRRLLSVKDGEAIRVDLFSPTGNVALSSATIEVDFVTQQRRRGVEEIDVAGLTQELLSSFSLHFLAIDQFFALKWKDTNLLLKVTALEVVSVDGAPGADSSVFRGVLGQQTQPFFVKAPTNPPLSLVGQPEGQSRTNIFRADWSFEKMGVGGLDQEFSDIFRRAFASRIFPVGVLRKLGISHVKGMLLYGPAGTGKTLIARQIGKMLNGKEPKVVNGPEILSKYVGQSEENIRALFAEAEAEQQEKGDNSELHIIIFDEIDSVCKQRGSSRDGTGVHDTVVNQLLSKIDGVNSLNNILVIGMTNRKDMIDEALLRPGRLEVQVEISLPDQRGRQQILSIHTAKMRQAKCIAADVDLEELAQRTKNFSGAEIEGLVKSAASFALSKHVQLDNLKDANADGVQLTRADFEEALKEVRPAFGVSADDLEACVANGIIEYGGALPQLLATTDTLVKQLQAAERTALLSVIFEGCVGSGKTALAASMALKSRFPFVKLLSPNTMIGVGEAAKAQMIAKTFDDAHRSPLSVVVLDDLERLLDYVRIGPRFSNVILQTLLTCIKKVPSKKSKLLILATTSSAEVIDSLELLDAFSVKLQVPAMGADSALCVLQKLGVSNAAEVAPTLGSISGGVPIKKLLLVAEMSMQGSSHLDPALFTSTLADAGLLA